MFPKQPEELFVVILAIYETWPQEPKVGVSALQTSSEEIGHKTDHSANHFGGESWILRMLSFCFNADRRQSSVECCVTRTDQELQAHQQWLLCMHWRPCLLLVSGDIDGFLWAWANGLKLWNDAKFIRITSACVKWHPCLHFLCIALYLFGCVRNRGLIPVKCGQYSLAFSYGTEKHLNSVWSIWVCLKIVYP